MASSVPASNRPFRIGNKSKRQTHHARLRQAKNKQERERRFKLKKEEDKDPELRRERLAKNVTVTLDQKRVWDDGDDDSLGARVDVERLKRRRIEEDEAAQNLPPDPAGDDEDRDSMLDSDEERGGDDENDDDDGHDDDDDDDDEGGIQEASDDKRRQIPTAARDGSVAPSATSTHLDLTPSSLALKFPSLFDDAPAPAPKILVTTSLNSTLHDRALLLTTIFPNSNYIRRSSHRYGHKYSLREICKFSSNRDYTAVVMLREDQKKPAGLTIVCLPAGPTFTFSISNWMDGKKIPGHGNPTNHYPELLLNNFKTPLGLLTAKLFQSLFPPRPEFRGRQVVTVHNQRDYLFFRRHRYVFRDKRSTEKNVTTTDGKELEGVQGIRAGLQELGPRFTLKMRRVDKGIGRAGSEGDDAVQWEWKSRMEKNRKAFNL